LEHLSNEELQQLQAEIERLLERYPDREKLEAFLNDDDAVDSDTLGHLVRTGGIDASALFEDIRYHIAHYLKGKS